MLGVTVPEVERAVAAGGAEGTVLRVEGNGVDGVDVGDVARVGGCLPMAFEGEVRAGGMEVSRVPWWIAWGSRRARKRLTWSLFPRRIGSHIALLCSRLQSRLRR